MSVSHLIEPISGKPGPVRLGAAADWMQGRTLYGGASALVAYVAATRAFPDLPPLRAAQIGFVAPVGEEVELAAQVVRQGRSVTTPRPPAEFKDWNDLLQGKRKQGEGAA